MSITINTPAELDELPTGSEVEDAEGDTGLKIAGSVFAVPGFEQPVRSDFFDYPVIVRGLGPA
ncbi:hypothetical protein [Streptomyces rimosus]|uniref:hypothetical protein n=1 Tax=Streptomyces rimosus TaxID=1927 RepID=UPI0037D5BCF3